MYIDIYMSALLHRHHKNTNLFIDSTSIFSSAPSGEMSSEFGILPTWLAYKSGVRDNLPVLCIMLPCITSHCRLALLMARRFFSWRTKNRKQIKYSFSPKYRLATLSRGSQKSLPCLSDSFFIHIQFFIYHWTCSCPENIWNTCCCIINWYLR